MKKVLMFGLVCLSLFSCENESSNLDVFDMKCMSDGDTIVIQGLGDYSQLEVLVIKDVIERRCHIPTKIGEPIELTDDKIYEGKLNIEKSLLDYDNKTNKILVTNTKCYSTVEKRPVGGVGELGGNLIIIGKNPNNTTERVLIHEMGHCFGLDHCENPMCVMSQTRENDNLKLNFCDDCKKKF